MKQKILAIVGPTASGKSDLAVILARTYNGEVISADSRQVYKGLNAGSGKITRKEMRDVPHHLLDVVDPKEQFSVADYKILAEKKIQEILSRGNLPIIVGGTGFYIDAVTGRAALPDVPPNPALRKKLEAKSAEALFKLLQKKDPARAAAIDPRNKVRVIRALEIIQKLGKVPTSPSLAARESTPLLAKERGSIQYIWLGLEPQKADLEKKIRDRLLKRMPKMIAEAKNLHKKGLTWKRMESLGLEYRYLARFLQKKISKQEMFDNLFIESKHYAKRQMTWFKRNKEIKWFDPTKFTPSDVQDLLNQIRTK